MLIDSYRSANTEQQHITFVYMYNYTITYYNKTLAAWKTRSTYDIYIVATQSTQQYSQWWLKKIHWYIELHQVSDKYGIREVKFSYVVYPREVGMAGVEAQVKI